MAAMNGRVLLKRRPTGAPTVGDFEIADAPMPAPGEGEILCRTIYLSLDPYMRGRMNEGRSYATPAQVGQPMVGGTVSEVVESRHPGFAKGDFVLGYDGWQAYAVSRGIGMRKLDPRQAPISTALGVLGMPGMTAYVGLLDIGRPKEARPSSSRRLPARSGRPSARSPRSRAAGSSAWREKCDYVVKELGFDACVNHKAEDLVPALEKACPRGIVSILKTSAAVYSPRSSGLSTRTRGSRSAASSPSTTPRRPRRGRTSGRCWSTAPSSRASSSPTISTGWGLADCTRWVREGRLKYREDIVEGLENAPGAFIGLFQGRNFGKLLVRVGADPTGSIAWR